jgi:predicted acylesterase/phospholipase RssA
LLTAHDNYRILAGVSAGAILSAFLAQFPQGAEAAAVSSVQSLLSLLRARHVYRRWWPLGLAEGLWRGSFYSAEPLHHLLRDELSVPAVRSSGRMLRIGAVSLAGGDFVLFNERCEDLHGAVAASAAFPGFLDPVELQGQRFIDGGVRSYTPIAAAIEAGATSIDVVMASAEEPAPLSISRPSAPRVVARALELAADELMDKDLKLARAYNALAMTGHPERKLVPIRVIRPRAELTLGTWDFDDASACAAAATLGAQDARVALLQPQGSEPPPAGL